MSRDLNQCNFIGRLGADPETKYLSSGSAVTNISIACSDDYKDKQTGQNVEKTEWVRVSIFGRLAEIAGEYLRKGSKVFISGKFTTRKWQDQSGQDRYSTEIVANQMQMLDSKSDGQQQGAQQQSPPSAQGYAQQSPQQMQASQQPPSAGFDGANDYIPF